METKLLEVRDRATFIPVIAVLMTAMHKEEAGEVYSFAEEFMLRRAGYSLESPLVALSYAKADGRPFDYDPYSWSNRTMQTAHRYIQEHWNELESGDVVDVEFILGESTEKKKSERLE